jgi:hypothetical protein
MKELDTEIESASWNEFTISHFILATVAAEYVPAGQGSGIVASTRTIITYWTGIAI